MSLSSQSRVSMTVTYTDGSQERGQVFVEEFLKCLQAGIENRSVDKREYLRLGRLPCGYVDAVITDDPETFKVVLKFPPGMRRYNYFGTREYVIPQPEMLAFVTVEAGKLREMRVFSLAGDDKLYHFPTANVYDTGKVCMGITERPKMTSIKDAENAVSYFYGTEFNNDLYRPGVTVPDLPEFCNQEGLLRALERISEYPSEWLVPTKIEVKQYIEHFLA